MGAESLRELLLRAQASIDGNAGGELSDRLAEGVKSRIGAEVVVGQVSRVGGHPEPGCDRYALSLSAVVGGEGVGLGEARLYLCEGGLPPAPVGDR